MNKKLLTAAVGAALAAGPMFAAQAGSVTVYGHAQVELASEDFDDNLAGTDADEFLNTSKFTRGTNGGSTSDSAVTVEDNARGRMGVKAKEDLGGGLKGIVKFEWVVDTSKGGVPVKSRESYAGLQGSWGTFKAGELRTPYKYYGGAAYDPFIATNLEARRNGGMTGGVYGHNGFLGQSLGYTSPKKKGPVQFWVVYSPDEKGTAVVGNGAGGSNEGDDGDYSAGVKFSKKNWEAFIATVKNKHNSTGTSQDYTATKIGGMWKSGPHKIVAQYEDTKEENTAIGGGFASGQNNEGKLLFVGYHLKFGGNNTLVVQVGDGELEFKGTSLSKQEHTYVTAGVIHKFSKKTRVFAGYSNTDVDNESGVATADGDRKVVTIGIRKDF